MIGLVLAGICFAAIEEWEPPAGSSGAATLEPADTTPYVSEVAEGPGIAVAVLLDNSGSMAENAPGDNRPKYLMARAALRQVLGATRAHLRGDSALPVQVGIYHFASDVRRVLPIAPYDSAAVERALTLIPPPGEGTAIGDAMATARADLYRAGMFRKYLLVITDGESNEGAPPEQVAAEIARRSERGVGIYYVAFDVDPAAFAFVREAGGEVLPATGGAQLTTALTQLYEERILAESADYGDAFPQPARSDTADTEKREP